MLFEENDKPNPFQDKTSKELWAIDEDKKVVAERNGFQEMVVWEKDYRDNKELIVQKCLNFLNNE